MCKKCRCCDKCDFLKQKYNKLLGKLSLQLEADIKPFRDAYNKAYADILEKDYAPTRLFDDILRNFHDQTGPIRIKFNLESQKLMKRLTLRRDHIHSANRKF